MVFQNLSNPLFNKSCTFLCLNFQAKASFSKIPTNECPWKMKENYILFIDGIEFMTYLISGVRGAYST